MTSTSVEADDVKFEITSIRRLENGDYEIRWTASPGDYSVEYSYDLTDWLELDDPTIESGESSAITIDNFIANPQDGSAPPPRVQYRIKVVE